MMGCSERTMIWIKILAAGGVSRYRWSKLTESIQPVEILEMLGTSAGRCELGRLTRRTVEPIDDRIVSRNLKFTSNIRCGAISIGDGAYPDLLGKIASPPPVLYYRGDVRILSRPSLCIVGSRISSRRGLITARKLARELSRRGIVVTSGMARGIDSAAHAGALEEDGGTIAVLGCGLDVLYPPENAELAVEIARHGCLISEFPPGSSPLRHHFPRRNRIMSGLSLGAIVVEAGLKSGAMNTARWAVDQNKEVFAVPGPPEHPGTRGPHRLIREGAKLVETVDDILEEFPPFGKLVSPLPAGTDSRSAHACDAGSPAGPPARDTGSPAGSPTRNAAISAGSTETERTVISALGLDPKHIDDLVQICHISATLLQPLLLDLEIRGVVVSCGGGTYALPEDRHA
jgi:DNA processing protein